MTAALSIINEYYRTTRLKINIDLGE